MILTLSLTPSVAAHVEHHAGLHGLSSAEWVRRRLEDHAGQHRPSPWAKPVLASDNLLDKDRKARIAEQAAALAQLGNVTPIRNRKKNDRPHDDDWY